VRKGYINGGVYLVNRLLFKGFTLPEKFSFEKDLLESQTETLKIYGMECLGYFVDIGIPEDYEKVRADLPGLNLYPF
jgi:D-glycero-alpha-D-manno-heptose 1-phosphate guanylyltransferase